MRAGAAPRGRAGHVASGVGDLRWERDSVVMCGQVLELTGREACGGLSPVMRGTQERVLQLVLRAADYEAIEVVVYRLRKLAHTGMCR